MKTSLLLAACASAGLAGCGPLGPSDTDISYAPESVDFGEVAYGTDQSTDITLINSGEEQPLVTLFVDGVGFYGLWPDEGLVLAADEEVSFRLIFQPDRIGVHEAELVLWAQGVEQRMPLAGEGT